MSRSLPPAARRVLVLNWRDSSHPEGGGSERYIENVARMLAAEGREVTLLCAAHDGHRGRESRDGIDYLHRGGRLTVYLRALLHLLLNRYDVVVDVQNGVPFWSPLFTRARVVILVHHVHREVWPVAVGPLAARIGWFLESRVAPVVYRRCAYVAVSDATRDELVTLGVDARRISVVHNGTEAWQFSDAAPTVRPTLCVVGRLVPHKQVEHAVSVLADLPEEMGAELHVVGQGYWRPHIADHARQLGVEDRVRFHGYLDDARKHEVLSSSWVHVCPSLKEGWGLVCVEAARHGVPTVAYRHAGGVVESVLDGETGVLVEDGHAMAKAVRLLLEDHEERIRLGRQARDFARSFSWAASAGSFARVLDGAVAEPGR
jgi:glycosyltransferase involved in cell wall biosynthesis